MDIIDIVILVIIVIVALVILQIAFPIVLIIVIIYIAFRLMNKVNLQSSTENYDVLNLYPNCNVNWYPMLKYQMPPYTRGNYNVYISETTPIIPL